MQCTQAQLPLAVPSANGGDTKSRIFRDRKPTQILKFIDYSGRFFRLQQASWPRSRQTGMYYHIFCRALEEP